MDPLFILEKAMWVWEIPLDRVLRPQIQQLIKAVQQISEQWGGLKPGALEANDQDVISVNNTIALVGAALFAVLSYLHMRYEPEYYVGEAQTLQAWVRETAPRIEHTTLRQAMSRTWQQTIRQDGRIWCDVFAQWTLERDTPSTRERLAYKAASSTPILLVQRMLLFREIRLSFIKGQRTTSQCLDVVMGFGGEESRTPGSSLTKSLLVPYAPRRVYLPHGARTEKDIQTAVRDMYALFSIYLIQAGFSSLDDDPTVRDFLFNYVGQYKHSKLEEHRLLYAILQAILGRRKTGHSRALKKLPPEELQSLVLYTWPDDYRALRQYVRKTATGVEISLHHADHEPAHQLPFYTISSAAKLLGIPRTTLYRYVKEGKIETKQKDMGDKSDKSQLVILEEEFCRLKQQLDQQKSQDESDKMLFQYCAEASGIKPKSLQRQVQRLKKQGNSAEVIRQHFQQDAQRRLQDSDT